MGTRNSTIVKVNGKIKVAQYGQWDGYPSGQGATIVKTLKNCDLNDLKEKCSNLLKITAKELKECWKDCGAGNDEWVSMEASEKFKEKYFYLHRDCGGKILNEILSGNCKKVSLDIGFAKGSSGFFGCEWAYIVDLDNNTLEVYGGTIQKSNLIKSYNLLELPEVEDFEKECYEIDAQRCS